MPRFAIVILLLLGCGQSAPTATAPPAATAEPSAAKASTSEPSTSEPSTSEPSTQPPTASVPPVTTTQPKPQPPPQPERNIYIDTVEIGNPIVVTGRARTFENSVSLRLRDRNGKLLLETFTTSDGEIGHHNPYRATLWVPRAPGSSVTVEALEYSARDGSEQSLVSVTRPYAVTLTGVRLYLPDRDCTGVTPHLRRIPKSISMARLLVEALMADPATPFPKEARVNSVNLRDGVLTVDFNERLQNVGGACAAEMIRQSVTRTLRTLPSVKKVVITAAGSEKLALQP